MGFYRAWAVNAALLVGLVAGDRLPLAVTARAGQTDAECQTERVSQTERLMGVPWTITVHANTAAAGRTAIAAGFAEATRLEHILSDYDPESELSRLSALAPMADTQSYVFTVTSRGRSATTGLEVEITAVLDRSTLPARILEYREQ